MFPFRRIAQTENSGAPTLVKTPPTIEDIVSKQWKLPKAEKAAEAVRTFSPIERYMFFFLVALLVVSALSMLWRVNNAFLVTIPERGGTIQEGIIGSPRFINPLLAISDADRDLTALVYSGLLRAAPGGELIPDLAESFTVSPDGLIYSFVIKDGARFHDGTPVTADDVIYTVLMAQDPMLKSPRRVNWDGVRVEKAGDREVHFILKQPYAPFLENATTGILPQHIWENIDVDEFPFSNFNIEPIGSGPYKVDSLKRDSGGIPVYYHLKPFKRFTLGEPYINNVIIKFYGNESELVEAAEDGAIRSLHGVSPEHAVNFDETSVRTAGLPRIFGVFLNQSQNPVFTNTAVRKALDSALDKQAIVDTVLLGYGTPTNGPFPSTHTPNQSKPDTETDRITYARSILENAGWSQNEETGVLEKGGDEPQTLSFSISTSDTPELKKAAELVASEWRKLGADVEVLIFELSDLNQNVIRPRKYDALLFGQVVGRNPDLYPFWHSSQRNDPGLNIAQYASVKSDKLLEETRSTTDSAIREQKYEEFAAELAKDAPAVFLYSPSLIYVMPPEINNVKFGAIASPSDRFSNIYEWYVETNKVWGVFAEQK